MKYSQAQNDANYVQKIKPGQSGSDGHQFRRTERIEVRFSPIEKMALENLALNSGYKNLAHYLRESGLCSGSSIKPTEASIENLRYLQAINQIADAVINISNLTVDGQCSSEEVLFHLVHIQATTEKIWQAVCEGKCLYTEVA